MNEYSEKRTVSRAVPIDRGPIVERQYDSVVTDREPTSGVAIAALVIAAVAAAVVITIMILNSQQADRDQQLAQERDRLAATQQSQPTQQPSQPAPIIVMPQSGAPAQTSPSSQVAPPAEATAPSSIDVEIAVTSKLLDDQELHSYPVDVKVKAGTVTLSGNLPTEELKARAERVARTVKGVRDVTNKITVQP